VLAALTFLFWQLLPLAWAPPPAAWALASALAWAAYLILRPRGHVLHVSEQLLVVWGFISCLALLSYLGSDPDFQVRRRGGGGRAPPPCLARARSGQRPAKPPRHPSARRPRPRARRARAPFSHTPVPQGWGDVYYFCGRGMQHCTCDFKWNLRGWRKAAVRERRGGEGVVWERARVGRRRLRPSRDTVRPRLKASTVPDARPPPSVAALPCTHPPPQTRSRCCGTLFCRPRSARSGCWCSSASTASCPVGGWRRRLGRRRACVSRPHTPKAPTCLDGPPRAAPLPPARAPDAGPLTPFLSPLFRPPRQARSLSRGSRLCRSAGASCPTG
jgi:hypothetical protein